MSFQELCPIFGRVVAEWSAPPHTTSSAPFLFHVHGSGNDRSDLRVIATDFQSNTFQTIKARQQLEDLVSHLSYSLFLFSDSKFKLFHPCLVWWGFFYFTCMGFVPITDQGQVLSSEYGTEMMLLCLKMEPKWCYFLEGGTKMMLFYWKMLVLRSLLLLWAFSNWP